MRLLLRHAFRDLGLQRVYLTVVEDNERAIRTYEQCGLVVEGRLRRHAYKQGQLKDLIFMGICADDPGWDRAESTERDQRARRRMAHSGATLSMPASPAATAESLATEESALRPGSDGDGTS